MARQGGGRGAMTRGGGRGGGRGGRIQGGGRGGARGRSRGGGRIQGRRGGGTSPGGRKGGRNAGGNSGSSGKGPRLSTQLLRAIGASGNQGNAGSDDDHDDKETAGDVYEYEEGIPEEERGKNKRFDDIDQMEYELPSDFEDEEIDEDEAFGHEDREVEDEGDTPSLPKGKKTKEISLNEDYDDDEDDDDDDDDSDDDDLEDEEGVVGGRLDLDSDESVDESGGEEEEEEEDEEDDDERHQRLIDAVTGRAAKPDRDHRRRKGQVITEAYPESEFNLNPSGPSASGNAPITVQDLMNPLHDAAGFGTLRKRMEQLEKRGAPVEAPLPKVIQDRVDRKAGYEQTSADIALWQDVVKRNREAPTLIFNRREEAPTLTTATLANHFKPSNDFEKEIQKLLNQSKLMEAKDVEQAEVLELNKLTVEEVRERQHRLAKMRDLLFRHETKAKRVRKIKSKTYHKLLQKSERSKAEHDMALTEADPEAAKEAAIKQEFLRAQERMTLKHKNQSRWAKRILKRGLKAQENDGTRDAIADQLRTHALLTRKIHSATFGGSDDDSSNSEDDMESGDNEPTGLVLNPKTKVLAKAKVATLKALEDGDDDEVPKTGLFAIPFMARAIEKKKKAAELEAIEMIELIEQAEADGDILAFADDYVKLENAEKNETTQSKQRMKISATSTSELECSSKVVDDHAGVDFTTNSVARVFSTGVEDVPPKQLTTNYAVTFEEEPENKGVQVSNGNNGINSPPINENGVISTGLSKTNGCEEVPTVEVSPAYSGKRKKKQRKPKVNGVLQTRNGEKDSSAKQYVHGGTPKRPKKAANGTAVAAPLASNGDKDDSSNHYVVGFAGRPKTDSNNVGVRDAVQDNGQSRELSSNGEVQSTKMKEDAVTVATAQVSSFTDDDSDDAQELPNDLASQQELIRQAFAGDDVEAEFEQLKSQALDVEVLQGEGPVSLPGWGQWSHIQQRKGQPAWILKEQEELKRKRDNALDKRKDAKLKHVIISEKTDKKASKFSAANLPFPFKSKELYESSVRMPIGRDYNTDKAFRDMIRPAVIKSAGRIIDPIKREKPTAKETEMAASLSSRRKRPKK